MEMERLRKVNILSLSKFTWSDRDTREMIPGGTNRVKFVYRHWDKE